MTGGTRLARRSRAVADSTSTVSDGGERAPLFLHLVADGRPLLALSRRQNGARRSILQKLGDGTYAVQRGSCLCKEGPENARLLAQKDRFGLPLATRLCLSCGVAWTDPCLDDQSLARFYEEDYRPLYDDESGGGALTFLREAAHGHKIHRFVRRHANGPPIASAAEIGCGAGGILWPFHHSGLRVAGCDLGSEYLAVGTEAGVPGLVEGTSTALTPEAPYDLLIANHVLEHVPDPGTEIDGWGNMLSEHGLVYVEVPGLLRSVETYRDFGMYLQNAHLYHFTLDTLCDLMAKHGFRLIYGDERVRALFIRGSGPHQRDADVASKALRYLERRARRPRLYSNRVRARRVAQVTPAAGWALRKLVGNARAAKLSTAWLRWRYARHTGARLEAHPPAGMGKERDA